MYYISGESGLVRLRVGHKDVVWGVGHLCPRLVGLHTDRFLLLPLPLPSSSSFSSFSFSFLSFPLSLALLPFFGLLLDRPSAALRAYVTYVPCIKMQTMITTTLRSHAPTIHSLADVWNAASFIQSSRGISKVLHPFRRFFFPFFELTSLFLATPTCRWSFHLFDVPVNQFPISKIHLKHILHVIILTWKCGVFDKKGKEKREETNKKVKRMNGIWPPGRWSMFAFHRIADLLPSILSLCKCRILPIPVGTYLGVNEW